MNARVQVLVVAAVLLLAACRGNDVAVQDTEPLAVRIDRIAEAALEDGPVAGLSIAVFRGEEPLFANGYGSADLATQQAATAATVYDIASVSKPFTALAILKLVDEGKLGLTQRLSELLPEFPDPDQGRLITVRQLLNHTSGLNDYLAADFLRFRRSGSPAAPLTASFVLDYLGNRPLDARPGTEWQYSNSGFYLAGMIIERVAGQSWGAYIRDEIARPLGLHATVPCDSLARGGHAVGYNATGGDFQPEDYYAEAGVQGDGGLCSTVLDLGRLPAALAGSRLVREDLVREMMQPTTLEDGATIDYGLGIRLGELGRHPLWGHTGSILESYVSTLVHYPNENVTIAVLLNTADTTVDALVIEGLVAQEVLPLEDAGTGIAVPLDAASLYVGEYLGERDGNFGTIEPVEATDRLRYRIIETDRQLARVTAGASHPPLELVFLGNHSFGRRDWPLDRFVFDVANGRVRGYSEYYNGIFASFNRRVDVDRETGGGVSQRL